MSQKLLQQGPVRVPLAVDEVVELAVRRLTVAVARLHIHVVIQK